ncbi:MAG: hypothetical protein KAI40_01670 [Desulfobacterales bacterium]|nr:hypothetical protein [Desulfobacterales bacterium]
MSAFFKITFLVVWVFFILPWIGMAAFVMVIHVTDSFEIGIFVSILFCILSSVILLRIYSFFAKRAANVIVESIALKHGLKDEYFCYNDMTKIGFIIDNTHQKVYIGKANNGVVLSFSEISSIEWEDIPVEIGNRLRSNPRFRHSLHLRTTNFKFPSVDFLCPNRRSQEEAFQKIRAALKIS